MGKIERERHGYLWATTDEYKRIENLMASSGVYRASRSVNTKADFVRVALIAIGELLKRKPLSVPSGASQEDVVNAIVNAFKREG